MECVRRMYVIVLTAYAWDLGQPINWNPVGPRLVSAPINSTVTLYHGFSDWDGHDNHQEEDGPGTFTYVVGGDPVIVGLRGVERRYLGEANWEINPTFATAQFQGIATITCFNDDLAWVDGVYEPDRDDPTPDGLATEVSVEGD